MDVVDLDLDESELKGSRKMVEEEKEQNESGETTGSRSDPFQEEIDPQNGNNTNEVGEIEGNKQINNKFIRRPALIHPFWSD
jgi:hypothetical protein